jgi:iron transport multicopper oxidase
VRVLLLFSFPHELTLCVCVAPAFFHCHIFWHKQAGLATVMASGLDTIREETKPTAEWENLCAAYNALPEDEQ